jgi:hypothetical protein
MGSYIEYLKQGFWEKIYIYIRGLHSGVLPVYYSDHAATLQITYPTGNYNYDLTFPAHFFYLPQVTEIGTYEALTQAWLTCTLRDQCID